MTNVASLFSKPVRREVKAADVDWPIREQLVGIEIEVENMPGTKLQNNLTRYWTVHNDGSLRNDPGTEYVLVSPMAGKDLNRAIYSVFEGAKFQKSVTAGTHIHLDMLEESTDTDLVKKLMLLIFCLEDAVFEIADRGREFCGYTNKLASAPDYLVGAVLNGTEENAYDEMKIVCSEDQTKLGRYYGCNILSLQKYGSVEFRYFPTATNPEELIDWIKLCQCFKLAAHNLHNVDALYSIFEDEGTYRKFLQIFFRDWYEVFIKVVPQGWAHQMMKKALAIASAYASNNETEKFDIKAITDNKAVRDFLGMNKEVTAEVAVDPPPMYIQAPNERFTGVGEVPPYTVGVAYSSCTAVISVPDRDVWLGAGMISLMTPEDANISLSVLKHWSEATDLEPSLRKKKFSSDSVVYVRRAIKDLISSIRGTFFGDGGDDVKNILANEPMRLVKKNKKAATRPPPIFRAIQPRLENPPTEMPPELATFPDEEEAATIAPVMPPRPTAFNINSHIARMQEEANRLHRSQTSVQEWVMPSNTFTR